MKRNLIRYSFIIILMVMIVVFNMCEDRLWDNPRDKNSEVEADEWAPRNLTAEQISVSSAHLSWVQVEKEIDGFIIDRKIGDYGWLAEYAKIKLGDDMVTAWTDTAFVPDPVLVHLYKLKAYAYNEISSDVTISLTPVFPKPSDLTIFQLSETVLKLTWNDNSISEDGFKIDRKIDTGQWVVGFAQTNEDETQWSDSNAVYGKTHVYRIYGYKDDKASQSIEDQIINVIQAPGNLGATTIDDQSLQLSWTDHCGYESGFKIERNDGSGFTRVAEVNTDVTAYTDVGLTYGQSYSYRVKAFTTNKESDYSNEIQSEMVIPAPSNLVASIVDDQSLRLTWIDNCDYESGFRIERDDGSGFTQIAEVSADVTTNTEDGLIYGLSYSYRITAFTTNNESNYSNESNSVEMNIPAPTNLTIDIIDEQSVNLTWEDNCTFEIGYKVERREEDGIFTEIVDLNVNTVTYTDQGLSVEIYYTYRVFAYTTDYQSNYSEEVIKNRWIIDIGGNVYQTVKIGDQWWMAENLKVTHYRNGDAIPNVTDGTEWTNLTTGAYCEYDNNSENVETYGRLYNWYAVNDSRNIAPEGWHVPSDEEWKQLEMYLGMSQSEADNTGWRGTDQGSQLAGNADLWSGDLENNTAFGSSGFAALPGGYRSGGSGYGGTQGTYAASFWSATEHGSLSAWSRELCYLYSGVGRGYSDKESGFSVRCVRD